MNNDELDFNKKIHFDFLQILVVCRIGKGWMRMSIYSISDFLDKILSSESGQATWKTMENYFSDLGFDVVNFGVINKREGTLRGMFTNMDKDWIEEYVAGNYASFDPFASYAALNSCDLLYSNQTRSGLLNAENHVAQKIMTGAAEFGMRTSIVSPFHHSHENYTVGFNLGTSLETNDFLRFIKQNKDSALLGAALAQSFTLKLLNDKHHVESWVALNDSTLKLTSREIETLNWLANGLRVDRIGEKMNISNDTVNFHIKSIKNKLKAKTREHAVAIAFIENIIR